MGTHVPEVQSSITTLSGTSEISLIRIFQGSGFINPLLFVKTSTCDPVSVVLYVKIAHVLPEPSSIVDGVNIDPLPPLLEREIVTAPVDATLVEMINREVSHTVASVGPLIVIMGTTGGSSTSIITFLDTVPPLPVQLTVYVAPL